MNSYTHTPTPYPNLFFGTLQQVGWLFYHPSAWRSHIAHIAPGLRPDFTLSHLNRHHWQNPAIRRLLLQCYLLWPCAISLLVALILLWSNLSGKTIFTNSIAIVMASIAFGITMGASVGVAASVACSTVLGAVLAVPELVNALNLRVNSDLLTFFLIGIVGGVVGGMVGSINRSLNKDQRAPYANYIRQISSVIAGALIGALLFGLVLSTASFFSQTIASFPIVLALLALTMHGVIGRWHTRVWRRALVIDVLVIAIGSFMALLLYLAIPQESLDLSAIIGEVIIVLLFSAFFAPSYWITARFAGPWAGAAAGTMGIAGGAALYIFISLFPIISPRIAAPDLDTWRFVLAVLTSGLLMMLISLALPLWQPLLFYPFLALGNILLYFMDERRIREGQALLFHFHPAFWDEHQRLRWINLDQHLVMVAEHRPADGQAAIDYLTTGHQRWAAQAAQIELDARRLERCNDVTALAAVHRTLGAGELTGPTSALLRSFSRISQDIDAAIKQESTYNRRLALSAVEDRLDNLLRELTRSSEPYAVRFRPIATHWQRVVAAHTQELSTAVELRQEIDSPYVIGVPLTDQQEIFVGRTDISAHIEQLLLDRRRPPLLLYGQRRMGKTSLLNNLGRLLPSTIIPLFVDLQGPVSLAKDHTGFLYNLARSMSESAHKQRNLDLPPLPREKLADDPFTHFDEWLNQVEQRVGSHTALLALDEFEALDNALNVGRFEEASVLGMLRHIIQHRPRFKVLLTASHTLTELARWASYLINVQVVHVGYLKATEAHQLIERPVEGFELRYEPEASARVFSLTQGHPFLTQLLCAEIVALKNEHAPAIRRLARVADVEAAVPEALNHGSFFFADIQRNQINHDGLALLRYLARQGEAVNVPIEQLASQTPDHARFSHTLNALMRRELIECDTHTCRFQVELVRRWFLANGN